MVGLSSRLSHNPALSDLRRSYQSLRPTAKGVHQVLVQAPLVTVFIDKDLGTGVDKKKDTGDPSLKWNKGTLFVAACALYISIQESFKQQK